MPLTSNKNNITKVSDNPTPLSRDKLDANFQELINVINDAGTVKAIADGKIKTFVSDTAPTADEVGDLWFDSSNQYLPHRWDGTSWVDIHRLDFATNAQSLAGTATNVAANPAGVAAYLGKYGMGGAANNVLADGTDLNTVTTPGDYTIGNAWTNGPSDGGSTVDIAHAQLSVTHSGIDTVSQEIMPWTSSVKFFRNGNPIGIGGSWQGFVKVWDSGSFDPASYLTKANASSTYLTQSNASSTYLTQSNASSTYLTQLNAAADYVTISAASTNYMPKSNTSGTDTAGFFTAIQQSVTSSPYVLPAGGGWEYFLVGYNSGNAVVQTVAGVAAGGSSIYNVGAYGAANVQGYIRKIS